MVQVVLSLDVLSKFTAIIASQAAWSPDAYI
jgi:hypothetical protein